MTPTSHRGIIAPANTPRDAIQRMNAAINKVLLMPAVRARINKSLRWIVANSLPVLTPQLFVRNQKVPDEDTDLGLDFVLSRVLAQSAGAEGKP